MAITLDLVVGNPGSPAVGQQQMQYVLTVTNGNASAVSLLSLSVSEPTGSAQIAQPQILTPNVPVGVGNPIIPAGGTFVRSFSVAYTNPTVPGETPNANAGAYPYATYTLTAVSQTSDGSVVTDTLDVPVTTVVTA